MSKIDTFRKREWTEDVAEDSPLAGTFVSVTVRSLNRKKVNASQADSYAAMREARGDLYDAWREDIAARNERRALADAAAEKAGDGTKGAEGDDEDAQKTYRNRVMEAGHYPDTLARVGVVRLDDEDWPTGDVEVRALVDELPTDVVEYLAFVVALKNGIVKEDEARPIDSPAS